MRGSFLEAAQDLGVSLDPEQIDQLTAFAELIRKWNAKVNLVSRQDIERLENRHLLDSLAAAPHLNVGTHLDIGSGAGLPGVVLAIARPEYKFLLCERMARRCRFLQTVVQTLGLKNVDIVEASVESISEQTFDGITARAVAKPNVIWDWVSHLLADSGSIINFLSTQLSVEEEIDDLGYDIPCKVTYHRYQLPGIDQAHTLMKMEHKT